MTKNQHVLPAVIEGVKIFSEQYVLGRQNFVINKEVGDTLYYETNSNFVKI